MSVVGGEMPMMRYPVGSLDRAAGAALEALSSLWSGMQSSAPKALRWGLEHAVALAVVAGVATVAAIAVRWWLTKRALTRRVRYAMLPTETFDPSPEEIVRFASQLSRARRSVGSFGPRRSDSVRLHLVSAPGGRMLQLIEGPARSDSVLRMGGLAEVELRPLDDVDVEALDALALSPSAVEDEGEAAGEAPTGHRDRAVMAAAERDEALGAERGDVDDEEWMH